MAIIATQQEHNIVSFLSTYLSLSERRLENMSTRRTPFHGRRRTDRYSDLPAVSGEPVPDAPKKKTYFNV